MQVQSHFTAAVCKRLMLAMVFSPALALAQTPPNIVVTFTSAFDPTSVTPVPLSGVGILAVFAIAVSVLWLRRRSITQFSSIFALSLAIGIGSLGLSFNNAVNASNAQRIMPLQTSPTRVAAQDQLSEVLQLRNDTQVGIRLQSILLENNSRDAYRLGTAEDDPALTQRCSSEQVLLPNDVCLLHIIYTEQPPVTNLDSVPASASTLLPALGLGTSFADSGSLLYLGGWGRGPAQTGS